MNRNYHKSYQKSIHKLKYIKLIFIIKMIEYKMQFKHFKILIIQKQYIYFQNFIS